MRINELPNKLRAFPTGKKVVLSATVFIVLLLIISSAAHMLPRSINSSDSLVKNTSSAVPESLKVDVVGDTRGRTVIAPAKFSIRDSENKEITSITGLVNQTNEVHGKGFVIGKYSVELIESPVLSDGSIFVLSKPVGFELSNTSRNSSETALSIVIKLDRLEIAKMTQDQLYYSSEKVREAGNRELADALLGLKQSAPASNKEDHSTKADMIWHEAVTEQVKVVDREAWSETVQVGGKLVTCYYCNCGKGPFPLNDWSHVPPLDPNTPTVYDNLNRPVYSQEHGQYKIVDILIGATQKVINHPEEYHMETRVIKPAGWYPK